MAMDDPLGVSLEWFEEWRKRTGENPPHFAALPAIPDLPPLLQFQDGRAVKTPAEWQKRRGELRALLERYMWGRLPETVPRVKGAEVTAQERERGVIRRRIEVSFDTRPVDISARIEIETFTPEGGGPFPVFLTQSTHRAWAMVGASRGYVGCVYPAADGTDQSSIFVDAYPDRDWMAIPRRAWLAGRVLDYLFTLDEVDQDKVCITGHSRNGKQALIAAAIDERIGAVVASSAGDPCAAPYRFHSECGSVCSLEHVTRGQPHWFHPRLRFFTGRENRLPVDAHAHLALIAPRHCLLSTAINDGCESSFAVERAVRAARPVYELLGRADALKIRWRTGGHETCSEDIHSYFDWFDLAFGRGTREFPDEFLYAFDWDAWRARAGEIPEAPSDARAAIAWSLGELAPVATAWGMGYGKETDHDALMLTRLKTPTEVKRLPVQFGDYLSGDLYVPAGDVKAPLPVVIWLHPLSYAKGYRGHYAGDGTIEPIFVQLARRGIACFGFDHVGFGRRIREGKAFYDRFPRWSKMGRMVADVRAAVDFLLQGEGRFSFTVSADYLAPIPEVDAKRVFCIGYSIGGMVALYAAALDERIAGMASFCGFTPLRTDTDAKSTGGTRRWWELYNTQPRLGLYHGREQELPFDFEDVLSLIAPRPCLVDSPVYDRDADVEDVKACVQRAAPAWQDAAPGRGLIHLAPEVYNRFHQSDYDTFFAWLDGVL
jgi:cephalosporin-C deacetylase-like acetyl esterase